MGWSIQSFGKSTITLGDGPLVVLLCLLEDEVKRSPSAFPRLGRVIEVWQENADRSGPGTIDLSLDETMNSIEDRAELAHALKGIRSYLDRVKVVPAELLNERVTAQGMIFNDYAAAPLSDAIDQLVSLLNLNTSG